MLLTIQLYLRYFPIYLVGFQTLTTKHSEVNYEELTTLPDKPLAQLEGQAENKKTINN